MVDVDLQNKIKFNMAETSFEAQPVVKGKFFSKS